MTTNEKLLLKSKLSVTLSWFLSTLKDDESKDYMLELILRDTKEFIDSKNK